MIYSQYIEPEVYVTFIASQIIYLISLLQLNKSPRLYKNNNKSIERKLINYNILIFAMTISLIISAFLFIFTTGIETFTLSSRGEKLSNYTIWYFISGIIATSLIILNIIQKKKWKFYFFPVSYLLFDLIMGDRTFLFLGIISFVTAIFFSKEIKLGVKKRFQIGTVLILILFIALVYKPFYFAISQGYFDIQDVDEYFRRAIIGSEPFVIIGNFNEIVRFGGITLEKNYLFNTLFSYLPMYESITNSNRVSFNSLFQGLLFSYTEWGLGSTSFGELYSMGGLIAIFVFLFFIFCFLKLKVPKSDFLKIIYFFLLPYVLFYFHRTDWHHFIGMFRLFIYSFIFILPIYLSLYLLRNVQRK